MESNFDTLKSEFFYLKDFNNLDEFEAGQGEYVGKTGDIWLPRLHAVL